MKLRVRVDHATYSALKEVEEEYREVLEDAINYLSLIHISEPTRPY